MLDVPNIIPRANARAATVITPSASATEPEDFHFAAWCEQNGIPTGVAVPFVVFDLAERAFINSDAQSSLLLKAYQLLGRDPFHVRPGIWENGVKLDTAAIADAAWQRDLAAINYELAAE
jgi:hypothetical protein